MIWMCVRIFCKIVCTHCMLQDSMYTLYVCVGRVFVCVCTHCMYVCVYGWSLCVCMHTLYVCVSMCGLSLLLVCGGWVSFRYLLNSCLMLLFGTVQIENVRRRHNYLPFIMELLKILAKEKKLLPLIERVGLPVHDSRSCFNVSCIFWKYGFTIVFRPEMSCVVPWRWIFCDIIQCFLFL